LVKKYSEIGFGLIDQIKKIKSTTFEKTSLSKSFYNYLKEKNNNIFFENRACYFIPPDKKTWRESKDFCSNILNNSHSKLYEFDNENEFNMTIVKIREAFPNITKVDGFHIGLEMKQDSKLHSNMKMKIFYIYLKFSLKIKLNIKFLFFKYNILVEWSLSKTDNTNSIGEFIHRFQNRQILLERKELIEKYHNYSNFQNFDTNDQIITNRLKRENLDNWGNGLWNSFEHSFAFIVFNGSELKLKFLNDLTKTEQKYSICKYGTS